MPKDLTALMNPRSVSVIGASRTPTKLGAIILKNIVDSKYKGQIYPVNPKAKKISGLKVFKDIDSLPETPDLAVVALPAEIVVEILKQVGEKGIKNAVVIAAGFKEIGPEGEKLEKELIVVANKFEINLLGPNCLGFVNNALPINVTFGQPVNNDGNLRFISQSGAIASSLFDWCQSTGLGFSDFVTLGNKAVLNENDILEYLYDKSQNTLYTEESEGMSNVSPIGIYLESISDGAKFLELTSKIAKNDPIFVLKPGKTKASIKAMQSHTGAIAGESDVLDAVLEQAGAIRCETLEQFFDFSKAFSWEKVPLGPNVAVISNAGGPAVISADAIISEGLQLAKFDEETKKQLAKFLPRSSSIINPVDLLGDALADRFSEALEIILQKEEVHSLVVILTPQVMTQIEKTAESIGRLSKKYQKPVFCSFMGGSLVAKGAEKLNEFKIPSFNFPEQAIAAIGAMWRFKTLQEEQRDKRVDSKLVLKSKENIIRSAIQEAVTKNYKTLDNVTASKILSSVGISTPPTQTVANEKEAKKFAEKNGWPVVLKLSSPGLLHKKEIGGVIVNIMDNKHLRDAWHKLERKRDQLDEEVRKDLTFQIQEDILDGIEVIVGIKHDPNFGPVLLFGAGGTYAELIADRNLHLLPMGLAQIRKLVENSKVYPILKGKGGEPPYALDKLYNLILRLTKLAELIPEASDIEVNPVIITLNNAWAVDGKIILREGTPELATLPQFKIAKTLKHEILATKFHYYEFETEEPLSFKPGQYLSVKVSNSAVRAYSIACHEGLNKFDLLVDTRPGGPGSRFFENLRVNDKMAFLGPFGVFTLNLDDGAEHILFMATGTGISALRCMLDALLKEKKVKTPITLYFGLTHVEEIFWKDYLDEMAQKYPNFNYEISIFEPDETWKEHKGYITDLLKRDFPDTKKCAAYLCGHRAMITDAKNILLEKGCPKDRIYSEKFI